MSEYPIPRKKNPEIKKNPESRELKSRDLKNPESRANKSRDSRKSRITGIRISRIKITRLRKKIPNPEFLEFSGFFSRFSNPDSDPRDFGIHGILLSGFFQNFFEVLISRYRFPGFLDFKDFLIKPE